MQIKRTVGVREVTKDGCVVKAILKWSNDGQAEETGRSWYLVINGSVIYPPKAEGITSEELARDWAGMKIRPLGYELK